MHPGYFLMVGPLTLLIHDIRFGIGGVLLVFAVTAFVMWHRPLQVPRFCLVRIDGSIRYA
jgi:hypothetical protein